MLKKSFGGQLSSRRIISKLHPKTPSCTKKPQSIIDTRRQLLRGFRWRPHPNVHQMFTPMKEQLLFNIMQSSNIMQQNGLTYHCGAETNSPWFSDRNSEFSRYHKCTAEVCWGMTSSWSLNLNVPSYLPRWCKLNSEKTTLIWKANSISN